MKTLNPRSGLLPLFVSAIAVLSVSQLPAQTADSASKLSPAEQKLTANSQSGHSTFLLFYAANDSATQTVYRTLTTEAAKRKDAAILPVRANDPVERGLIARFDVTRTPLPAIVALAPNGAVTGVFSQQIKVEEFDGAIVSPGYAQCIKAMQDNRVVLLCVQPETRAFVPQGVQQFQADRLYRERTHVVNISANDPAEARFIQQLRLRPAAATPQVVFMAPPGVLLGAYDSNVTHATLSDTLVKAGKCCDDKNCKHHRTATGATSTQTR